MLSTCNAVTPFNRYVIQGPNKKQNIKIFRHHSVLIHTKYWAVPDMFVSLSLQGAGKVGDSVFRCVPPRNSSHYRGDNLVVFLGYSKL